MAAGFYAHRQYLYWRYPLEFNDDVTFYAAENNLDPALVYAVIIAESGANPSAVSRAGAVGLMQVLESTKEWLLTKMPGDYKETFIGDKGSADLYDPSVNIAVGTFYLNYLYNRFGDWDTVLCAYNAGETKVGSDWLRNPEYSDDGKTLKHIPYPETKNYVEKVNKTKEIYDKLHFG